MQPGICAYVPMPGQDSLIPNVTNGSPDSFWDRKVIVPEAATGQGTMPAASNPVPAPQPLVPRDHAHNLAGSGRSPAPGAPPSQPGLYLVTVTVGAANFKVYWIRNLRCVKCLCSPHTFTRRVNDAPVAVWKKQHTVGNKQSQYKRGHGKLLKPRPFTYIA